MAYVMLSRCANFEDLYIDEVFDATMIKTVPAAEAEHNNLLERSFIPKVKEQSYDCFVLNVNRLMTHLEDLEHDIYANQSKIIGGM